MALAKQFEKELNKLLNRRTAHLRSLLRKQAGAPLTFSKKVREQGINRLQEIASAILCKARARDELRHVTRVLRQRRIKGHGVNKRFERIVRWAEKLPGGPVVYSFWRGKRCLYVGKGKSWRRLNGYQKSIYLKEATNLKIRLVTSKSQLPKAECLEVHLFEPRDNKIKAARKKWGKACPICKVHDRIRSELLAMFRLR